MSRGLFAIVVNTIREITRQGIFYFIVCGGSLLILFSFSFTLFAFGEETKMIKEMGISTITICCVCLASLSATNAISREIEKGTVMTLLCKPVSKYSILLGKFFGILAVVFLIFVTMGFLLAISLSFKDSLEYHKGLLTSIADMGYSTFFELVFSFLQVAIICSIAIAGSIYLPMISNLSFCIFIYIIGNLMHFFQDLLRKDEGGFPWYLSLFFVFFPNFSSFNTLSMEVGCEGFNLTYMALLTTYTIFYIALVILLTFELFDNRECS